MKAQFGWFSLLLVVLFALAFTGNSDLEHYRSCAQCGMDRKAYGYSRMLIEYQDGTFSGVCSLRCAALEMAAEGRVVKTVLAADRESHELVNAAEATWVLGGKKRGVMTKEPKWAFRTSAGAQEFIKENGGRIATWEEALAAARTELEGGHREK